MLEAKKNENRSIYDALRETKAVLADVERLAKLLKEAVSETDGGDPMGTPFIDILGIEGIATAFRRACQSEAVLTNLNSLASGVAIDAEEIASCAALYRSGDDDAEHARCSIKE